MTFLSVQVNGREVLEERLGSLQEALNTDEILDELAAIMLTRIRARYLDETDPDGQKWPVSKAALERKAIGRGGGTLFDTGRLFQSIQAIDDGPTQRRIATDVPYSRKHQLGEGRLPRRTFLGFGDDDIKVITSLIRNRIERALV